MKLASLAFSFVAAACLSLWASFAATASDLADIVARIRAEAVKLGVPPDLAMSVGYVETGFDPTRIGAAGEVGLMQVMPTTAAGMGFLGANAALADVDTNIHYGVGYLAEAWTLANHDVCLTLAKYNAGHETQTMSTMTSDYCRKAVAYLVSIHSPLADGVKIPMGAPSGRDLASLPLLPVDTGPHRSKIFWAHEKARVKALNARLEARWRRNAVHNDRLASLRPSAASRATGENADP